MKKNKKNNISEDIDKIYREMETELINKMYKTLTYHKKEEAKEGFEWEQWQKAKLRDIRQFRRESKSIIRRATRSVKKLIPESILESIERGAKSVSDWAKRNIQKIKGLINPEILIPSDRPEDPNFEPIFFKTDPNLRKETIDEALKIADDCERAIYRCTNDAYRKVIVKANMKQLEGVKTVDQGVKEALDEFKKQGISYITYSDGKRVPINVYARMALRTARHRAYLKSGGAKRKELGVTKIIVSKHDTSCPLCKPFQHKVLIDDVYSGGTREDGDEMLLSEAMERGLFHPNCEHDVATYFEGVTIIPKVEFKEDIDRFWKEQNPDMTIDDIRKYFKKEYSLGFLPKKIFPKDFAGEKVIIRNYDIARILFRHRQHMTKEEFLSLEKAVKEPDYIFQALRRDDNSIIIASNIENDKKHMLETILVKTNETFTIHHLKRRSKDLKKIKNREKLVYKKD